MGLPDDVALRDSSDQTTTVFNSCASSSSPMLIRHDRSRSNEKFEELRLRTENNNGEGYNNRMSEEMGVHAFDGCSSVRVRSP